MSNIHWPTFYLAFMIIGCIDFGAFMFWICTRLARRDVEAIEELTELSSRNIAVPKYDPPSYGLRIVE